MLTRKDAVVNGLGVVSHMRNRHVIGLVTITHSSSPRWSVFVGGKEVSWQGSREDAIAELLRVVNEEKGDGYARFQN